MKKWIAIFVFLVYTFGATDAYQLLKLPLLVKHFRIHCQENPGISFAQFLHMHYSGKLVIDDDFQQDLQLPFKTHETVCCIAIATLLPVLIEIPARHTAQHCLTYRLVNDTVPDILAPRPIFQPPRT